MQVSIDIETLGSGLEGRIIHIGAVAFNFGRGVQTPGELLEDPTMWLDVAVKPYLSEVDNDVVDWWNQPEQAAAKALINSRPAESIEDALNFLSAFISRTLGNKAGIWAKPPQFDLARLAHAYDLYGIERPWHRKQECCQRTLLWVASRVPRNKFRIPDLDATGMTKHYALHDAVVQAIQSQAAYRALIEHNVDFLKAQRTESR